MISKQGMAQFFARQLDDHDWIKRESRSSLLKAVAKVEPSFGFLTKPFDHQLSAFLLGVYFPEFLYLLDLGLGKTKVVLDVFRFRQMYDASGPMLVTVPRDVNVEGWLEEVELHTDLIAMPLIGDSKQKWGAFQEYADLYIVSYSGLYHMVSDMKEGKLRPNEKKCRQLSSKVDFLTLDEVHKAKNKKSLTFRICNRIAKSVNFRYGLTGTPFGREPKDLWAQFYLVDRGQTLGPNLGTFYQAFYSKGKNEAGYPVWNFDTAKEKILNRFIRNRSIRYEDDECHDLPPTTHQIVPITLSPEAAGYYMPARKAMRSAKGDFTKVEVSFTRMREICSGFFRWRDDEGRAEVSFASNPKIAALQTVLEALPENRKVIIIHVYKPSGKMIVALLKELSLSFVEIHGGMQKEEGLERPRKFKTDSKIKVMVANYDMISHGGNFQVANYTIFFEEPASVIDMRQVVKRTHRTGQTRRTYYYYLLTSGTVEEKLHTYLQEGKDLFKAILEGNEDV